MSRDVIGLLGMVLLIIALGLFLRFGRSSVALFQTGFAGLEHETQILTLAGNYPYYGP